MGGSLFDMVFTEEIRIIKSQHPGGVLLPPVQKLVATSIFCRWQKMHIESHYPHQA
jgi:hypothetical protein